MRKILIILLFIVINYTIVNANSYECTSHDLYHVPVYNMTNSDDIYKCENYWMQWNTINTKWWNDKVYISKQTWSKPLIVNLWDGNDDFYHTYHNVQLRWTTIDGGNWVDTVHILNDNSDNYEIIWNCKNSCTISRKSNSYLFRDVVLKNIEKIVFDDKTITYDTYSNNSTSNNTSSNNNQEVLSNYKYLIPAYWWSYIT